MTVSAKTDEQIAMLINRIQKNRRRLGSWIVNNGVTCYRLYDRDIPEVPLAVDWYEGRLHIAYYQKSDDSDNALHKWLDSVSRRLSEALAVSPDQVFVKFRKQGKGGTLYEPISRTGHLVSVQEAGLTFLLNLKDYLDTGLFLDHRVTRQMVRDEAQGKRFLNLFAYTGAFTVYAAAGGAETTTSVDLSATYLDWAAENLEANGFSQDRHQLVRDDIPNALEERAVQGTYDLVVIDPPTVSRSKAMKRLFDVQRDHGLVLSRVLERVSKGGVVYFSTNLRKLKLDEDLLNCRELSDITEKTTPPDFQRRPPHRCYRLVK